MYNYNTFLFTILYSVKIANLGVINDITFIASVRIHATEYIHQCGFTGAVFTYQRMNLALFNLKIYIVQGFHTGECFGDIFHFQ